MKLQFNRSVILRIPRFPLGAQLEDHWPQLKSLIAESSADFYEKIKDLDYSQISSQPERIRNTIWKYFNRSKNRSTPFGGLASVAVCPGSYQHGERQPIQLSDDVILHELPDWSAKESFTYSFDQLYEAEGRLFSNSTYYVIANGTIRYVGFFEKTFKLMETPNDDFILAALEYCRVPILVQELYNKFPDLEYNTFRNNIEALVSMQLLLTSLDPNIIGDDYFRRIGFKPENTAVNYTISERQCQQGSFDFRVLRGLDKLVNTLQYHQKSVSNPRLDTFADQFRNRYDQQEVPLMLALDPEYGIGYADLEQQTAESEIIGSLSAGRMVSERTDVVTLVGNNISAASECRVKEIDLETLISDQEGAPAIKPVPNSMSLLCTLAEGKVWIEHLGNATSCAMAGRFTLASDDIHNLAKEIARRESMANPDVIFFDIGYMAEGQVDNVNRRRQIYDAQLTLLNYDDSDKPLTLDDITVQLRGSELILRSRSLNKRLIPRLATAYNHSRSDLSVFRLLCDLQHQGLHTSFNLQLDNQFPHFAFYPRVKYRQFILSPAKWHIRMVDQKPDESLPEYLKRLNVNRTFRAGTADQVLYFDSQRVEDIKILSRQLERQGELLLEETPIPEQELVQDCSGQNYTAQFLLQVYHDDLIYSGLSTLYEDVVSLNTERDYLLNSTWLYWEIFCHPSHTDNLLDIIQELLQDYRPLIQQWFFIRYDKGGEHIRLRVKTYNVESNSQISARLMFLLSTAYKEGAIWDIKQCIYRRELERYGNDIIGAVEEHFYIDSEYAVTVLLNELTDMHKYKLCIEVIKKASAQINVDSASLHAHMDSTLKAFEREHQLKADGFKQLNELYRNSKAYKIELPTLEFYRNFDRMYNSLIKTVNTCPERRRSLLFTDLLHMHINRLFCTDQRTHELAIYYMFVKDGRF
ncbi:MAG: lantibiotic dehydratase [Taibaiella sp.]|nr:lantibiotic dehydratase [Taibaiella sp.]